MSNNYVRIGTTINKPDKDQPSNSSQRQRLHGAFQGGFSAGYHNTVGSKEGWQPKQFISTRTQRIKNNQTVLADTLKQPRPTQSILHH